MLSRFTFQTLRCRGLISLLIILFAQFGCVPVRVINHNAVPGLTQAQQDTVRAIHALFDQKHSRGLAKTMGGAAVGAGFTGTVVILGALAYAVTAPLAGALGGQPRYSVGRLMGIGLLYSTPAWFVSGAGIVQLARYGNRRRYRVIDAYQRGEPLPQYVRQALTPQYFTTYR